MAWALACAVWVLPVRAQEAPVVPPVPAPEAAAAPAKRGIVPVREADTPFSAPVTPVARLYSDRARQALALEVQVQEFEQTTLGLEDPETLEGPRKERRLRIERDKAFHALAGQFSMRPLALPDPAQAPDASREALSFFAALLQGYEATRQIGELDRLTENNQSFLKTGNWSARDRAVGIRDALIERGILFTTLAQRAWDVRNGTLADDAIPELMALLRSEVPEPEEKVSDLAVVVLDNPTLRATVFSELTAILAVPLTAAPPLPPEAELAPLVVSTQKELLEVSGLTEVMQQRGQLDGELARVNADLEKAPSKILLDLKVKIITRRVQLEEQWYKTDPDPALFEQLVEAQDQLVRRRMADLGPPGVLFGARLDALEESRAATDETSWSRWTLLQEQRDMLDALAAARPAPTPLDGLAPPPTAQIDYLAEAKKEQAAKAAKQAGQNAIFGKQKKGAAGYGTLSGKATKKPKPQPKPGGAQAPPPMPHGAQG